MSRMPSGTFGSDLSIFFYRIIIVFIKNNGSRGGSIV